MLPDYIIYDELRRRKELDEMERNRPHLEVPRYVPYWPEMESDEDKKKEDEREDSSVIIIQM